MLSIKHSSLWTGMNEVTDEQVLYKGSTRDHKRATWQVLQVSKGMLINTLRHVVERE